MNQSANLATVTADLRVVPTMRDLEESWRRCCERLRTELGEDVFTSWFGRLTIESVEGGRAYFSVPTRFLKSWIESHYNEQILGVLEAEIGGMSSIAICVRSSTCAPGPQSAAPTKLAPSSKSAEPAKRGAPRASAPPAPRAGQKSEGGSHDELLIGSPLDRRLTFAYFLVGRSNQLAYSAAQRVAEDRWRPAAGLQPAFRSFLGRARQDAFVAGRSRMPRRARPAASSI